MGQTPRTEDLTIEFDCQFRVKVPDVRLATLLKAFCGLVPNLLADFLQKALVGYAELSMSRERKAFSCDRCENNRTFIWKTREGRKTKILTTFAWVTIRQLQVQCRACGHKFYLTRKLLGLGRRKRISDEVRRKLGLLGALTPYRVAAKFMATFGAVIDKMTIWKAVQKTGAEMEFALDPNECPHGEADGTGIGIRGIKKRGKELKVLIQYRKNGSVRVAGIDIGPYNGSWKKLFSQSLPALKKFTSFLLVTDGDTSILDGLKGKVTVLFQRCLWHIPYQLKVFLWQDRKKVERKSSAWLHIMAEVTEICAIRSGVEDEDEIKAMIASKLERFNKIVAYCKEKGLSHTVSYLSNARPDLFTAVQNRLQGKTTSRVERLFRTVNMRVNVSHWSTTGALNVTKVRLAYYYNGFDA